MIQILSILVAGLGIGWLSGLSVSPVIATVLASLVGIAGGLVAGLRASSVKPGDKTAADRLSAVNAIPAAVLILGIAVGAPLGIVARTHQIFEPADAPVRTDATAQGVLFNLTAEHCDRLRARARDANEQAFRTTLYNTGEWGRLLETHISDTQTLKRVVEDICAPK
jgi:hypothetical protein